MEACEDRTIGLFAECNDNLGVDNFDLSSEEWSAIHKPRPLDLSLKPAVIAFEAKNGVREEGHVASSFGAWITDRDSCKPDQLNECFICWAVRACAAFLSCKGGHVAPVLADNHEPSVEVSLPE